MNEIKTPRDAKGMNKLKGTPTTHHDIFTRVIPARTHANLYHCHSLRYARDIVRIDRREWEPRVSDMLKKMEKQRITLNNRFYHTLEQVKKLLDDSHKREEKLQVITEEMEASNEELEATNEEMQATTEELEIVNKNRQILMDSMLDILMTTDLTGVITEINKATELISGYSREELIGKPFGQFFTAPEMAQAGIEMAAREEEVSNYDLTLVAKDGHEVEVSYSAVVLRDSEGRVTGILGSAQDITTRKRTETKLQTMTEEMEEANEELKATNEEIQATTEELESSREFLSAILDSTVDAILTVDERGVIQSINKGTINLFGYSEKELLRMNLSEILHESSRSDFMNNISLCQLEKKEESKSK